MQRKPAEMTEWNRAEHADSLAAEGGGEISLGHC
jgi:hypothetical protein